ncbi:ATP-binding protein [bacterium]|nr:ATP-binding protein [bacterium]
MPNFYRNRIVEAELRQRLAAAGAVVIEGPKACGKTATAETLAASVVLLDVDEQARRAADIEPSLVLAGKTPRLIDEWQVVPSIWNHVRRAVDARRQPGQFILTGSAVPADDITRHTGAGRLSRVRMRPMSLFESGHSVGSVSMQSLLDGRHAKTPDSGLTIPRLAELIAVGGWPGNLGKTPAKAIVAVRGYIDEIRRADINRVDGVRRDPTKIGRLLRALARNESTSATAATIAADTGTGDAAIGDDTVRGYLDALERLMIVENQPAWAPHLRSRSRLRQGPKRRFVDPSLAVASLRAGPERLLADMGLLGFLFESLVIRDLRIYAQAADADVFHYRDNTGLEVDAIVEAQDGRWAAFEVKLGQAAIDEASETLLRFADRIDTKKCGEPATLAVITGNGFGYVRPDGVAVIPIGSLGP